METAQEQGGDLRSLLESTVNLSEGLETLYSEHEALLAMLKKEEEKHKHASEPGGRGGGAVSEREERDEFGNYLREEKTVALTTSLKQLHIGLQETKLMYMLAQYLNSLEGDKKILRAQVKRLCSENNWLRTELADHQQLLQETEVELARVKEEKDQLEFTLHNLKEGRATREQSPSMDIDVQEEKAEGVHAQSSSSVEYEVPENIKTLHHLALQYVNQGKPEIAVPFCKKAVQELKRKKGSEDPDVAAMLNVLAVIYREQGKLKEAIKCLHETLDIREKHFHLEHPAVASTYNNLSVLHGKTGNFKAAEPYCKKALEIRQKLLGPNHPDVAKQFTNLAILCQHLGKYDEVEYYYQRALEIYQTELGADDPNIAKTMSNLASCYLKQGKYKAAEATYKNVLASVETREVSGGGGSHGNLPSPVQSGGWVLSSTAETSGSKKAGVREVTPEAGGGSGGWYKSAPVQSPTVTSTLRNLSTVYRELGKVDKADELDRLTQQQQLDSSQHDRVSRLLAEADLSSDHSRSGSPTLLKGQAFRQKRPTLSQSVRRLFRLKVEPDLPDDATSQDGSMLQPRPSSAQQIRSDSLSGNL